MSAGAGRPPALAAAVVVALVALGLPVGLLAAASATGAPSPAGPRTGTFGVEDAQLRWGLNNESNNRAFAPGTVNLLSAGKVPDPGQGGQTIVDGRWRGTSTQAWQATSGDVRIEKQRPDGTFATATWAGLTTTVAGTTMSGTNGPFSGHQVVIDGGTGTVDAAAGTATIRWEGSFSVVYYSGMTFFTVSDPELTVTPTGATLHATLAGYASSMEDQSIWRPVPAERVVLADLPAVDLTAAQGFNVSPRYLGVTHDAPGSDIAQVRTGPTWGAFPATYLAFMRKVGSSAYWYSSGGAADKHKVPTPIAISYDARTPVRPPAVEETGGTDTTDPSDPTGPSPTTPAGAQPPGPALPPLPVAATPPASLLTPGGLTVAATPLLGLPPTAPTVYALSSSDSADAPGPDSGLHWTWLAGSALLLGAAALTLLGTRSSSRVKGTA